MFGLAGPAVSRGSGACRTTTMAASSSVTTRITSVSVSCRRPMRRATRTTRLRPAWTCASAWTTRSGRMRSRPASTGARSSATTGGCGCSRRTRRRPCIAAIKFPDEYRGNVFVGESAGRLIRRSVLTEHGGIITGKNAYTEREFLFSHDERFRPVYSATGPDGALYVADMYRGIIEGHIFLTTFLRNQIVDRGLHQPFHGMGRIYRIVHEGQPLGTPPTVAPGKRRRGCPSLRTPTATGATWRSECSSPRGRQAVVPAVRTLATSHEDARVRLHGLWTLEGLGRQTTTCAGAVGGPLAPGAYRRAAHRRTTAGRRRLRGAPCWRWVTTRTCRCVARCSTRSERRERPMWRRRGCACCVATWRRRSRGRFHERPGGTRVADARHRWCGRPMWASDCPEHRALVTALATAVGNEGRAERSPRCVDCPDTERRPAWQPEAVLEGVQASNRARQRQPRPPPHPATPRRPHWSSRAGRPTRSAQPVTRRGRGLPSLAPPLAGSPRVTGPPEASSTSSCMAVMRTPPTRACRRWRDCRTTSWRPS